MHTASCDSLVGCLGLSWQFSSFRIINDINQCDDGVQRLTEWNYVDCEWCEDSNVLVLLCFPRFSTAARQCATLTAPLGERYSRSGDSCPPCHFLHGAPLKVHQTYGQTSAAQPVRAYSSMGKTSWSDLMPGATVWIVGEDILLASSLAAD